LIFRPLAALLLALAAQAAPAFGQAPTTLPATPAAKAEAAREQPHGVLRLQNRVIFTFRSPVLGYGPTDRADGAQRRLDAALKSGPPYRVTQARSENGIFVLINDAQIFAVVPGDTKTLAGETVESVAAAAAAELEKALAEYEESGSVERLLKALGYSAAGTAVFVFLLWGLVWLRRIGARRVLALAHAQAERLKIGDAEILDQELTLRATHMAITFAFWAMVLLLAYEYASFVLVQFPYTRPWGESIAGFLWRLFTGMGEAVIGALPDLAVAILIFFIAYGITGIARGFFDRVERGHISAGWLDPETARPTRRLLSGVIWIFALVMAYPYLPGAETDAFKGVSVLLGLMFSLGASSVIGQAVSGVILMYTRTIRRGEYVRIGDHEGTVMEIGVFTTRLRTGMGEELLLPSTLVVSTVAKNYSRVSEGRGFVIDTTVTIGYDAPWRQVHAMLIEAAKRTDGIVRDPLPKVFQTALSDFYVEYRLACVAIPSDPRPRAEVMSVLHQNIQDVFNEHGVQIMSPHYLGDPSQAKVVPVDQWYAAPAQKPSDAATR